jgi:aspartate/methionine/tyrosine aminotransferase
LDWLDGALPTEVAIVTDEVFADYRWEGALAQIPKRAFRLSGLSKICALPQMKIGWIVMPEMDGVAEAMEFVGDTYLSVSGPIAERAPAWLAKRDAFQAPVRNRCLENLARLGNGVEAGWVKIVEGPGDRDEESVALEMLERGFWVQPGYFYDLPMRESYVVSLLTPPEDLEEGLRALNSCGR